MLSLLLCGLILTGAAFGQTADWRLVWSDEFKGQDRLYCDGLPGCSSALMSSSTASSFVDAARSTRFVPSQVS
jgi:hypothetical protein